MAKLALTPTEEATLVRLLERCTPGQMSSDLFHQFCRLLPMIAIEVVTLRRTKGGIEVLLAQRPPDDPHFPGEWHSPGTILRVSDFEPITPGTSMNTLAQFSLAFQRLARNELGDTLDVLRFAGIAMQPSPRGPHLHLVFLNRKCPKEGEFFKVRHLPEPMMVAHRPIIHLALEEFVSLEHLEHSELI